MLCQIASLTGVSEVRHSDMWNWGSVALDFYAVLNSGQGHQRSFAQARQLIPPVKVTRADLQTGAQKALLA